MNPVVAPTYYGICFIPYVVVIRLRIPPDDIDHNLLGGSANSRTQTKPGCVRNLQVKRKAGEDA